MVIKDSSSISSSISGVINWIIIYIFVFVNISCQNHRRKRERERAKKNVFFLLNIKIKFKYVKVKRKQERFLLKQSRQNILNSIVSFKIYGKLKIITAVFYLHNNNNNIYN